MAEFSYDGARTKLVNLQIGALCGPRVIFNVPEDSEDWDQTSNLGHKARMMRLSSLVSTDGRLTVGPSVHFCSQVLI